MKIKLTLPKFVTRIIRITPKEIPAADSTAERTVDETITRGLKESDALTRALTLDLAGRIKAMSILPDIIVSLKDPLHYIRQKAAQTLGILGNKKAVPALIEALDDPSDEVRVTVAGVLGHLRDRIAVPALIQALQDKSAHTRMKAAIALGCIGDTKAINALARALKDENEFVRKYACQALGNLGRKAIPVLFDAMKDDRIRALASESLMRIK